MDHRDPSITTIQVGHQSSGPHNLPISISIIFLSFSISLTHLARMDLKSSPTSDHHHHLHVDPASIPSSILSHHSIHPSNWFGLMGFELVIIDMGIFNERYRVHLPLRKWKRRFTVLFLMGQNQSKGLVQGNFRNRGPRKRIDESNAPWTHLPLAWILR
ncbi:hypothetical protein AAC387_Pa03g1705 [Persea americana]